MRMCEICKNGTGEPICRNRDADVEDGCVAPVKGGMNWEIRVDIYTSLCKTDS